MNFMSSSSLLCMTTVSIAARLSVPSKVSTDYGIGTNGVLTTVSLWRSIIEVGISIETYTFDFLSEISEIVVCYNLFAILTGVFKLITSLMIVWFRIYYYLV